MSANLLFTLNYPLNDNMNKNMNAAVFSASVKNTGADSSYSFTFTILRNFDMLHIGYLSLVYTNYEESFLYIYAV